MMRRTRDIKTARRWAAGFQREGAWGLIYRCDASGMLIVIKKGAAAPKGATLIERRYGTSGVIY